MSSVDLVTSCIAQCISSILTLSCLYEQEKKMPPNIDIDGALLESVWIQFGCCLSLPKVSTA